MVSHIGSTRKPSHFLQQTSFCLTILVFFGLSPCWPWNVFRRNMLNQHMHTVLPLVQQEGLQACGVCATRMAAIVCRMTYSKRFMFRIKLDKENTEQCTFDQTFHPQDCAQSCFSPRCLSPSGPAICARGTSPVANRFPRRFVQAFHVLMSFRWLSIATSCAILVSWLQQILKK